MAGRVQKRLRQDQKVESRVKLQEMKRKGKSISYVVDPIYFLPQARMRRGMNMEVSD